MRVIVIAFVQKRPEKPMEQDAFISSIARAATRSEVAKPEINQKKKKTKILWEK